MWTWDLYGEYHGRRVIRRGVDLDFCSGITVYASAQAAKAAVLAFLSDGGGGVEVRAPLVDDNDNLVAESISTLLSGDTVWVDDIDKDSDWITLRVERLDVS